MTEHVKGCSCFLRAYACAGIVDKPAKKQKKPKACTCAPCCNCGYDGQDSDGADCYGKKGRNVIKGGVRFYGPHCFCWHASEADCAVHGSPESAELLDDLEPCPNSPFRIEENAGDFHMAGCTGQHSWHDGERFCKVGGDA